MRHLSIVQAAIVMGVLLFLAIPCFGRVLVVHSYHEEYDWVQGINWALESSFKSGVEYRIFYMDTKRRTDEAWKKRAAADAKNVIAEYAPQVVIAVDDNAQKYVAKEYVGRSRIQFVFCGVNANPKVYGYPSRNVTGILERAYPKQVLEMLKRINPNIKNVIWVSDDSQTTRGVLPRVKHKADTNELPLEILDYAKPSTFAQWKRTIQRFNQNPGVHAFLIPLYHTVKNRSGDKSVVASSVMEWTVKNTTKPIVGFWPFSTDDGALCAVAVDPHEHGKVAALMAKQILSGKSASDIPMVVNKNGFVILNLKTAHQLNIDVPFEVIQSADRIIEE